MASLERRYDGRFRVIFYWQRQKFVHSLGDVSEKDAGAAKVRVEENLRLLARGILEYDGSGDLGIFLLSDVKRKEKIAAAKPMTLGDLVERYRNEHLPGAKEASTRAKAPLVLRQVRCCAMNKLFCHALRRVAAELFKGLQLPKFVEPFFGIMGERRAPFFNAHR